ncbi:MAG TPA: hypothetical protein VK013_00120 [Myxococcaceae bacterium]|nr:hypothetical protein [Myxococcaceae bacterium]
MNNRIDFATPVRMSQSTNVGRTAPDTSFGNRLKTGLDTVSGAVGSGVAAVAPHVPGGSIVSAAISNVSSLTNNASAGHATVGAVGGQYASGVTSLSGGGIPTAGGGSSVGGMPVGGGATGISAGFGAEMQSDAANLNRMLSFQVQFQRENQAYTAISNVMKTRHDTQKNTLQNIR